MSWETFIKGFTEKKIDGYLTHTHRDSQGVHSWIEVVYTKDSKDDKVQFIVSIPSEPPSWFVEGKKPQGWDSFPGTTNFSTSLGERTFDRRGIDSSFYVNTPEDLDKVIPEQLTRIDETRKRLASSVPVPGLPGSFTVDADRKAKIVETLKAGKPYTFTPAGFGTGYRITTRRRDRWTARADVKLERFLGFENLFVEPIDCD